MDCILSEIERAKEERFINTSDDTTARGLSYGVSKDIIEKHKRANPWLNRDLLNNYKRQKTQKSKPASTVTVRTIPDNVSDLTNGSNSQISPNSKASTILLCSDTFVATEEEAATNDNGLQVLKKGGRPKGSTAENMQAKARNLQQALNYASIEALSVKEAAIKDGNVRVNKGAYQSIIEETEKKLALKRAQ